MKKIIMLFLGLSMCVAVSVPSSALAAGLATLSLSPTNTVVETGDRFSLSVLVDPHGESLDTARVELDWDAAKLEVLSFDLGSQFPYLSPSNEIDNTNGDLSYGAYKYGPAVTSLGTLGTVTFHALAAGSTTVNVLSTSKLIFDGEEMINTSDLGFSTITIRGESVEAEAPEETITQEEESSTDFQTSNDASLEEQALVYFGALYARMPSSEQDWAALHCIAYGGCKGDPRELAAEQAALVVFGAKYATMPSTDMEWNVIDTLAYIDFFDDAFEVEEEDEVSIVDESLSLEAQALVYFVAFYARMPSSSNDWEALHCIAYGGCQGDPRDLQAEQDALVLFGAKYAKMPATSMEWNVLHTIAYTDILTWDEQGSEAATEAIEEATEVGDLSEDMIEEVITEVVEEVPVEEAIVLTPEQEAIGWFGTITGYLPSSDTDWLAIDYLVNGYTPETQDLEAESAAISMFVSVFGYLPASDSDWNIISAIAYSEAF
jgi:hypothetical protein